MCYQREKPNNQAEKSPCGFIAKNNLQTQGVLFLRFYLE